MEEKTPEIVLDEKAQENGLALMLSDMIRQNMEANPRRLKIFRRMKGNIEIIAQDSDSSVAITLAFEQNRLLVRDGLSEKYLIQVQSSYETLLILPQIRMILGLPWMFTKAAWQVLKEMVSRKLRIKGMIKHLLTNLRLLKLLSVFQTTWEKFQAKK